MRELNEDERKFAEQLGAVMKAQPATCMLYFTALGICIHDASSDGRNGSGSIDFKECLGVVNYSGVTDIGDY